MKLVLKCNWCDTFFHPKNEKVCKEHEDSCSRNPKRRGCYSCIHLRPEYLDFRCDKGASENETEGCSSWSPDINLDGRCLGCGNTLNDAGQCSGCDDENN